jgi:hypothetical protein
MSVIVMVLTGSPVGAAAAEPAAEAAVEAAADAAVEAAGAALLAAALSLLELVLLQPAIRSVAAATVAPGDNSRRRLVKRARGAWLIRIPLRSRPGPDAAGSGLANTDFKLRCCHRKTDE